MLLELNTLFVPDFKKPLLKVQELQSAPRDKRSLQACILPKPEKAYTVPTMAKTVAKRIKFVLRFMILFFKIIT